MSVKKIVILLTCLVMTAAAGCGAGNETADRTGGGQSSVQDVLESGMAEADGSPAGEAAQDQAQTAGRQSGVNENAPAPEAVDTAPVSGSGDIDVDLTALSGTMVYSEVYNMMASPGDYVGKTVKMDGTFALYHDEESDNYYFACIVKDATACCSQGIEFVLTDDYTYPDDYPAPDEEITVVGVFDTYMEGEYMYCTLRSAVLV